MGEEVPATSDDVTPETVRPPGDDTTAETVRPPGDEATPEPEPAGEALPPDTTRSFVRNTCLLYTSPSPRDRQKSRMPSSA